MPVLENASTARFLTDYPAALPTVLLRVNDPNRMIRNIYYWGFY